MDWITALNKLKGAYADSTLRAYRADINAYVKWCNTAGDKPFPSNIKLLVGFIDHQSGIYSISTIKRRLAAISKIHSLLLIDNPCQHIDVKLAFRRSLRSKSSRPRQSLGLTAKMRDQLLNACDGSLIGKRNRLLLSIGYDTLCRRSEIVEIQIEDIKAATRRNGTILIKRSKNDQVGLGRISHISPRSIKLIKDWLKASKLQDGPLFRGIKHNKVQSKSLHPHSINRIIKDTAKKAGFSDNIITMLTGHSMRIGAAQDMMTLGFDILPIMAAGGWKSINVVARYVENADKSEMLHKFFYNKK